MNGKRYKLSILPLFEDDLSEIVDYISIRLKNPIAAQNLVDDVERAIRDRLTCAEAFQPYPSVRDREHPYYCIPVKNFSIFYVVIGDTMEVRRILYSRRDMRRHI